MWRQRHVWGAPTWQPLPIQHLVPPWSNLTAGSAIQGSYTAPHSLEDEGQTMRVIFLGWQQSDGSAEQWLLAETRTILGYNFGIYAFVHQWKKAINRGYVKKCVCTSLLNTFSKQTVYVSNNIWLRKKTHSYISHVSSYFIFNVLPSMVFKAEFRGFGVL